MVITEEMDEHMRNQTSNGTCNDAKRCDRGHWKGVWCRNPVGWKRE